MCCSGKIHQHQCQPNPCHWNHVHTRCNCGCMGNVQIVSRLEDTRDSLRAELERIENQLANLRNE
jgi:hypothetical protein